MTLRVLLQLEPPTQLKQRRKIERYCDLSIFYWASLSAWCGHRNLRDLIYVTQGKGTWNSGWPILLAEPAPWGLLWRPLPLDRWPRRRFQVVIKMPRAQKLTDRLGKRWTTFKSWDDPASRYISDLATKNISGAIKRTPVHLILKINQRYPSSRKRSPAWFILYYIIIMM